MRSIRLTMLSAALLFAALSAAAVAASDPVSGKYQGIAKSASLGDIPLTVLIKNENGKLSGQIETPQGPAMITSGSYADGRISMKFDVGGNEGIVTAQHKDDVIIGEWELAGEKGTMELKRLGSPDVAAGDSLSGEWDGVIDAQGMTFPFTLRLKLEGETVTGDAESAQGSVAISNGSFKEEKLSFTLDTPQGPIKMTGTLKEGKLAGDFGLADFQGKWEAKKK